MVEKRSGKKKTTSTEAEAVESERWATPAELGFRMPAEWEPHEATWIAWPHNRTDWPRKGLMVEWVFAEMARHLAPGERVRVLVQGDKQEQRALAALSRSDVSLAYVDVYRMATNRSWTRDFLPLGITRKVKKKDGTLVRERGSVKWRFNGWARYDDYEADDAAGDTVARRMGVRCWRPHSLGGRKGARVVLEGGAIDVDGQGTLLATEQCLLTGPFPRNKALEKSGTERVLHDYLGIEKVLWLGDGIAGDDTSGHVDDFARFVAPGRVVLCQETKRSDDNYKPLARAKERLEAATDARGRKVEVIPLPMPAPVFFSGQRLPASYANFYVGNRVVLVPTFNDPQDRQALGLFGELFPKRKVVGIHCRDLVLGLGTLHCSTQQEPTGEPFR